MCFKCVLILVFFRFPKKLTMAQLRHLEIGIDATALGFKLSWPMTKLQNVVAGDPPSTITIDGVPVEGVLEFVYFGSKQSSNGYCRPDVLSRIGLACSVMNSLQSV